MSRRRNDPFDRRRPALADPINLYEMQKTHAPSDIHRARWHHAPGVRPSRTHTDAYVDARWTEKLPAVSETEAFMLEGVPEPRANSRLCCQIKMQAALDGIVVQLPEVQV
jgi:hypothetical protein